MTQIVPVEMRDLRGRSAVQRLTPDVAHPIGVHDKVNGFSIRTPGKRCSSTRCALKDCESSVAVCLHHGQKQRPSAESYPYVVAQRKQLIGDGTLVEKNGLLVFTRDREFSSPSAAAVVIHGGSANGLIAWKTQDGRSLKEVDEQS